MRLLDFANREHRMNVRDEFVRTEERPEILAERLENRAFFFRGGKVRAKAALSPGGKGSLPLT